MASNDIYSSPTRYARDYNRWFQRNDIWVLQHPVRIPPREMLPGLRSPSTSTTVWPGSFLELEVPTNFPSDTQLAIEPRTDFICLMSLSRVHPCLVQNMPSSTQSRESSDSSA